MTVYETNGILRASRVTGPQHNYLGLSFSSIECTPRVTERPDPGVTSASSKVSGKDVLRVILQVVARERLAFNRPLFVSLVEFTPTDYPCLTAYEELATAIVRHALNR